VGCVGWRILGKIWGEIGGRIGEIWEEGIGKNDRIEEEAK
jgi:hypothetical protein